MRSREHSRSVPPARPAASRSAPRRSARLPPRPEPAAGERLTDAADGNPLALIEIPTLLSDAQLDGTEPIEEPLPAGPTVERAFLRQIEALPDDTQRAVYVAAASETGRLDEISSSLESLLIEPNALDPAREAGLISVAEGRLDFRHPLLRAAAYHAAPDSLLREAHQALAAREG